MDWLSDAIDRVRQDPHVTAQLFAAAGRKVGREQAIAARVQLLQAVALAGADLIALVTEIYRYGDNDEKRAVLWALPSLEVADGCVELVRDALRSNDSRLVLIALGPYAHYLSDNEWRQAVLKAVFMDLPLSCVDSLVARADAELGRMLRGLCEERAAAGRALPADALTLMERLA